MKLSLVRVAMSSDDTPQDEETGIRRAIEAIPGNRNPPDGQFLLFSVSVGPE